MTRFTETLIDPDGNELNLNHYGQPDPTSRVYVEICADGEVIAAGPFTPEALHAALDEVAPASAWTRIRSLRNDRHYWQDRAEKAEKERDKARGALRAHLEERAQPRPITADDIESVLHSILPLSTEHLLADDIADLASDLYTALTEPPRPEGAEELEDHIAGMDVHLTPETVHAYANFLAERGVRVVAEEQS